MAAFDPATLDRWRALAIVDRDGTTVGTISEFYLDRETGHPTWALITTGIFGATQTFVPLIHATEISDGLQVPYEKSHIKDTPKVDPHDELTPEEEAELFAHYGVEYAQPPEAATGAAEPGSDEGAADGAAPGSEAAAPGSTAAPGPDEAEPGTAGSPTVAGDEGPGPVRAEAETARPPTATQAEPESAEGPAAPPIAAADARSGDRSVEDGAAPGSADEAVPREPESVEYLDAVGADSGPAGTPAGPGSGGVTGNVPDEPGTAEPDGTPRAGTQRTGDSEGSGSDYVRSADLHASDHDPELARTAPVEPGLPGSTVAAPYGPAPTVDKTTHRSEPLRVSDETDWPPGASGSFEEQLDRPRGTSDRWREAKLAAERDRIARASATHPEERSPLERARRRLERLVGGGQDSDADELSPADREAAERARRARLGMDDDDSRR